MHLFKFSFAASATKGRLTREKKNIQINIKTYKLMQVLHKTGAFIERLGPKEAVEPEHFYSTFDGVESCGKT